MDTRVASTSSLHEDKSSWYGIEDAKERKKIQDRLAQRARRKRLAAAKATSEARESPKPTTVLKTATSATTADQEGGWAVIKSASSSKDPMIPLPADQKLMPDPNLSFFSAMYRNGALLGLQCGVCVAQKSKPVPADVPAPLKPTAKQIMMIHAPWIDRFPFPRMRDHAIDLGGIIDDEEFIYDLASMRSFVIVQNGESWDPAAWRIGPEFAAKWGYLFY